MAEATSALTATSETAATVAIKADPSLLIQDDYIRWNDPKRLHPKSVMNI